MFEKANRCESSMCVEVEIDANEVRVRNSDNPNVVLTFTHDEWRVFTESIREDRQFLV
jgi:hypothetical protein